MKYFYVFALCTLLFSCSSDNSQPEAPDAPEFSTEFVTTEISQIGTNSVNIAVQITNSTFSRASRKILYRLKSTGEFREQSAGTIANLVSGKRYEYFVRIEFDSKTFDLPTNEFTTQGFLFDEDFVFAEVIEPHKKYRFINTVANGNMLTAAEPLSGYIKIGNDSIACSNVTVVGDAILEFEIDGALTQDFFTDDNGATMLKTFSLGLFSDAFYASIAPVNEINYDGTIGTPWSLFNKKPYISEGFTQDVDRCIQANGGRPGAITLRGNFWGGINESFSEDEINVYDNLTVRLTNLQDPDIERAYTSGELIESNFYTDCETEGVRRIRELIDGAFAGFHQVNMINVRYNPSFITPGPYSVTFAVEKDNVVYHSEAFEIQID